MVTLNKFFRTANNELLCYLSDSIVLDVGLQFDRYCCVIALRLGNYAKFGLFDFTIKLSEFELSLIYGDSEADDLIMDVGV